VAGILIVCATPIGNLDDASPRVAEALTAADVVYAEDTRRTSRLLQHLNIDRPLRSFFVGNEQDRATELRERLADGATVALVSDAGTPGIADPGVAAVRAAREAGATVTVVPGPSAVTTALAGSGLGGDRFVFDGFLPRSGTERSDRLAALATERRTIVLFSATRRVHEDLADLAAVLGADRLVTVGRELTKVHEELWSGLLGAAALRWAEDARGEFTIVIAGARIEAPSMETALAAVAAERADGVRLSAAVRSVAATLGVSRRHLYEAALRATDH